jgi:hypothetical protein
MNGSLPHRVAANTLAPPRRDIIASGPHVHDHAKPASLSKIAAAVAVTDLVLSLALSCLPVGIWRRRAAVRLQDAFVTRVPGNCFDRHQKMAAFN